MEKGEKEENERHGLLIQPYEKATISYNAVSIANFGQSPAPFSGDSFSCLQGAFKVYANVDGTMYVRNRKNANMFLVTIESGRETHCHIAVLKHEARVLPNYVINENGVTQKVMFNQRSDYLAELPNVPEFTVHLQRKNYCQRVDIIRSGGRPVSIIIVGLEPLMVRFNGDYACHRIKKLVGLTDVKFSGGFDVYEKRDERESDNESHYSGTTNSQDSSDESRKEEKPKKGNQLRVQATVPAGYLEVFANKRFSEIEVQGAMNMGENEPIEFPNDVAPVMRKTHTTPHREKTTKNIGNITKPSSNREATWTPISRSQPASGGKALRKKLEMPKEDEETAKLAKVRRMLKEKRAEEKEKRTEKAVTEKTPSEKSGISTEDEEKSEISGTSKKSDRRTKKQLDTLVKGLAELIAKLHTEKQSDEE